jgi:hypothetical protein
MSVVKFQRQGTLDGLCGHYAIVNALTECGIPKKWEDQETLFQFAVEYEPHAYKGMHFSKMQKILDSMKTRRGDPKWPKDLSVKYPFVAKIFDGTGAGDMYKSELMKLLSAPSTRCAIVQVQRQIDKWENHWIVVKKDGDRLQFIDSVTGVGNMSWASLRFGPQTNEQSTETAWRWIYPRQVSLFVKNSEIQ